MMMSQLEWLDRMIAFSDP